MSRKGVKLGPYKRKDRTTTLAYRSRADAASELGESNDCAVKAVSLITARPYAEVHKMFEEAGRKNKKGTPTEITKAVLLKMGWKMVNIGRPQVIFRAEYRPDWVLDITQRYPGAHKGLQALTTYHPKRFPDAWKHIPNCLVQCPGHIAAFMNGDIHDWSVTRSKRISCLYVLEACIPEG
jgi:hypothetical protein